jgi:hypothetical protein
MAVEFLVAKIQFNLRKSPKISYLRKVLRKPNGLLGLTFFRDIAMCNKSYAGTYQKVNALPVDAQSCLSLLL